MTSRRFMFSEVVRRAQNAFFAMYGVQDLRYQGVQGQEIEVPYEVTLFERSDAAAILLVDMERKCFVMLRNSRIGWAAHNARQSVNCTVDSGRFKYEDLTKLSGRTLNFSPDQCQLLEIIAGTRDNAHGPASLVKQEVLEEAGYASVKNVKSLGLFVPSPGASTEVIHLYLGYVEGEAEREVEGSALEDGVVAHLPFAEAKQAIENGEIIDGKTTVAILRFMLSNPKLFR